MAVREIFLLLGGLGLFLYGMKLMSDGLKLVAGFKMKKLLAKFTNNKWLGALIGIIITAVIQSSTATTVMVLGFVNSGLITLGGAIAIIIGANVGTAVTGILLSFNLQDVAPLIVFVGAALVLFMQKKKFNHSGMILLGFGILFIGLGFMSDSMVPLRSAPWMADVFEYARNPLIGILIGFAITAIIQSSTATLGIILAMISAGIITDLNQAIFILYGLNLGGTVTGLIATIGANRTAKQTAVANLISNSLGVGIFVILMLFGFDFAALIQRITPSVEGQLISAHIIFNVVKAILLLPFVSYIAKLAEKIVKPDEANETELKFNYIDRRMLNTPSIAVEQINQEIGRMMDIVLDNFIISVSVTNEKAQEKRLEEILKNEEIINYLNREINKFLVNFNTMKLDPHEIESINSCYKTIGSLERMGDLSKDIAYAIQHYLKDQQFSVKSIQKVEALAKKVEESLSISFELFKAETHDEEKVKEIREINKEVKKLIEAKGIIKGINLVRLTSNLNRVNNHALNIAKIQRYKAKKEEVLAEPKKAI